MAASSAKTFEMNRMTAPTTRATEEMAAPTLKERLRKLIHEVFEGHEEYLGVTPN
jgi:hypothetical protein